MQPEERRRNGTVALSPLETLKQLPALVVLERFPVPVLAIGQDGSILFVNQSFADMVGYQPNHLLTFNFRQIFRELPANEAVLSAVHARADLIVQLQHLDGSTVRARMSKSALLRGDDPVALATFHDLTEQLWLEEF